ncbi:MAG TPA: ATP-binding protein [Candidatus Dormibacteraeota bacterium]|nr:ATP-binding protein [Candidatus Dormibacteraeota bacterium]
MKTVGVENVHGDLLEAFSAAGAELSRFKTVPDVAEAALRLGLDLTNSTVAFIAVLDESGDTKRVFSKARTVADQLSDAEIERVFAMAGATTGPPAATAWTGVDGPGPIARPVIRSTCARTLDAGGESFGMFGIASPAGYSVVQLQAYDVLVRSVGAAIGIARMHERRQEMVDTLVNLRADLDRSERQRLINDERARSAERVERAHEAAVDALLAVSRHARTPHGLTDFYRRLTRSIAELVAARKVLFWKRNEEGMLVPIRGAYGVDDLFLSGLVAVPCAPDRDDLASRVVFHDLMFRASRSDEATDDFFVLDTLKVDSAIAVPWRAGDERLGLVAAYDSRRPEGFSREDTWVLQKAGLAAGLVWQLRYTDADLKKTAERLEKVDAARQMLLRNVSTAVEKARKRFAGDLHDDALQKLTAVELQLQRLRVPNGDYATLLTEAELLLAQTEDALRRLLFEVRPPALEMPGGFVETIRDRVRMLKTMTGAEVELELDLPDDLSFEFRSMLYRQVTEAITNVEKHAAATQVRVSLTVLDDGVHGIIQDNGRGFVVAERDRLPGHLGLLALNERALLAGGWNKIQSEPGLGTTVEFWIPLSESKSQA